MTLRSRFLCHVIVILRRHPTVFVRRQVYVYKYLGHLCSGCALLSSGVILVNWEVCFMQSIFA